MKMVATSRGLINAVPLFISANLREPFAMFSTNWPLASCNQLGQTNVAAGVRMMSRGSDWTPQVVKISDLKPHRNANALDVATVLGDYPVITKRNEFVIGDLAAYIPIDSVVPDNADFHFLSPRQTIQYEENGEKKSKSSDSARYPIGSVPEKYRIVKAKKLRGVYSQGLLVPCPPGLKESDSIIESLGLTKWEEEEEEKVSAIGRIEKPPSGWFIPHYDINGIRRFVSCLKEGEEVVLTEKIHGSNAAFVHDGIKFWVKSRNLYLRKDKDDMWWDVALRYDLESKLQKYPNKVFFGEIYGKNPGFRYDAVSNDKARSTKILFFDILDLAKGKYLNFDERVQIIEDCGLGHVPILYRGPWLGKDEMYKYAEGPTKLGGKHIKEGWVLNTVEERFEEEVDGRMQLKMVSEAYNLQK